MEHATQFVNCPHCGQIVEVVCPVLDKEPIGVYADKDNVFAVMRRASAKSLVGCENCGRTIYVYWRFRTY